jgi:Domain of unknown function (DUF397)
MEGTSALSWRKSSYSGNNGGNCVEAGSLPGAVIVRDTTDRDGRTLTFDTQAWHAFATRIKSDSAI